MAKEKKTRSFRVDKLEDAQVIESGSPDDLKDIKIDEIEMDEIPKGNLTKPPSLNESPLLDAGRIEMEYTSGDPTANTPPAPEPTPQPQAQHGTGTDPDPQEPTYTYEDTTNPTLPEQEFFTQPQGGAPSLASAEADSSDTMNLPDEAAKEGSAHLASFIMDAYERFVPEVTHYYSRANEKEIKKLEESGDLLTGALETVRNYNKSNKLLFEEKAKSDVKYLKKHLTKVLQIRQVSASPETLLAFAVIIVVIGQAILFFKIKKESDFMLDQILAKVNANKNGSNIKKDEILEPTVETV
jgi:hypothetical protein